MFNYNTESITVEVTALTIDGQQVTSEELTIEPRTDENISINLVKVIGENVLYTIFTSYLIIQK